MFILCLTSLNFLFRTKLMKKITQKQIAKMAGITETHLSFILNNKRHSSVYLAKKLGKIALDLGLPFNPEDWVFRPELIKQYLKENK